jgi:hypothetical protein
LPGHAAADLPLPARELPTRQALLVASHDLAGAAGHSSRSDPQLERSWRAALRAWGTSHPESLGLDPAALEVDGGNAGFRLDQDGFPTAIVTARFIQRNREAEAHLPDRLAGLPLIGGTTVIATAGGQVRHVVHAPVPGVGPAGEAALERLVAQAAPEARAALACVASPAGDAPAVPLPVPRRRGRTTAAAPARPAGAAP